MSPFKVLGITKYSSEDEIRIAYKKLLKKHHPDTGDGDRQKLDDIRQAFVNIKKIQSDSGSIITVTLNVKLSEDELKQMLNSLPSTFEYQINNTIPKGKR